jgi:hypothetical protein
VSLIEVIVELDEWWIKQKESDRGHHGILKLAAVP